MEELSLGTDEPGRRHPWWWVLAGVGVLVAGTLLTGLGGLSSSPPPAPVTGPVGPPVAPPAVYRPGPLTYLDVGSVCAPHTGGRRSLTVSFELVNRGGVQVRVLALTPQLPLGGLTPTRVRSGGTCARPGHASVRRTVLTGAGALYTMSFRLPARCPKAYPVQAAYRIDVNGQEMTAELPILSDLGTVDFTTC
jgi:hypothetical protein